MKHEQDIDRLVYTLYLNQESSGWIAAENSTLSFGSWNMSRFSDESSFQFVPADVTAGSWKVPVTSPALGGEAIKTQSRWGVLSTTQKKYVVPEKVYDAMYGAICDSWFRTCLTRDREIVWNCTSTSQSYFDDLTFKIGTLEVVVPATEYTQHYYSDYCYLNFVAGDNWVLGPPFLTKYYTVYNLEENKVGFALAKHDSEMSWWLFVVLIIVGLLVLACCAVCIVACVKKSRETQGGDLGQPLMGGSS